MRVHYLVLAAISLCTFGSGCLQSSNGDVKALDGKTRKKPEQTAIHDEVPGDEEHTLVAAVLQSDSADSSSQDVSAISGDDQIVPPSGGEESSRSWVAPRRLAVIPDDPMKKARGIGALLIDDSLSTDERKQILAENRELLVPMVAAMTEHLEPNTAEEDRRIPWIWRCAIAVSKEMNPEEVRLLLDYSMPTLEEPLRNWEAVVIGGGVINGISLMGPWPAPKIRTIIAGDDDLEARWQHTIEESSTMADNEEIITGTRYDALRIIALGSWDRYGGQLFRYLLKDVHPELQQGAVSGLADLDSPATMQALLSGFDHFTPGNKEFALAAMMRSESRIASLLDAIEAGDLTAEDIGPERVERLRTHESESIRQRAAELLPSDDFSSGEQ